MPRGTEKPICTQVLFIHIYSHMYTHIYINILFYISGFHNKYLYLYAIDGYLMVGGIFYS